MSLRGVSLRGCRLHRSEYAEVVECDWNVKEDEDWLTALPPPLLSLLLIMSSTRLMMALALGCAPLITPLSRSFDDDNAPDVPPALDAMDPPDSEDLNSSSTMPLMSYVSPSGCTYEYRMRLSVS